MQEATKDHDLFNGPPDEKVADPGTLESVSGEAEAYTGVKTVEAAEKVYGKYSKWLLFLGYVMKLNTVDGKADRFCFSLSLAAYVYSLDSCTTSIYLSYVASSFEEHSLISSIEIAQTVISTFALRWIWAYLKSFPVSFCWPTCNREVSGCNHSRHYIPDCLYVCIPPT